MLSRAEVGEKLRIVSNLDLSPSLERVKAAAEILDTDAALRAEIEGLKQKNAELQGWNDNQLVIIGQRRRVINTLTAQLAAWKEAHDAKVDTAQELRKQLIATKAHLAMVESGQAREDEIQILHDKIASWENLDDQYHALQQQLTASEARVKQLAEGFGLQSYVDAGVERACAGLKAQLQVERAEITNACANHFREAQRVRQQLTASEAQVQREIKRGDLYKTAGEQAQTQADTLQAHVTALEEALKEYVEYFEMDFILDGVVVDDPGQHFTRVYRIQKEALRS